jgi:hypothetical protein
MRQGSDEDLNISDLVRRLCPNATEEELREAQRNLDRYTAAVMRICERAGFGATDSPGDQSFDRFKDTS